MGRLFVKQRCDVSLVSSFSLSYNNVCRRYRVNNPAVCPWLLDDIDSIPNRFRAAFNVTSLPNKFITPLWSGFKYDRHYRLSGLVRLTHLNTSMSNINLIYNSAWTIYRSVPAVIPNVVFRKKRKWTKDKVAWKSTLGTSSVESDYSLTTESAFVVRPIHMCVNCQCHFANVLYFNRGGCSHA